MKNSVTLQTSKTTWADVVFAWKRVWEELRLTICMGLICLTLKIIPGDTNEGGRMIQGFIIMLSSIKEGKNASKNM